MQNRKAIFLLISANMVSGFAQGISMIAIPWHIINEMHNKELYQSIFFTVTFITLAWIPLAGTLIDRYPRKNLFLFNNAIGAIILLSVASFGFVNGHMPFWLMALVFGFTILNFNIHYPSLYALSQELVSKGNYGKVNSMLEIQGQATNVLAGAVSAFLLTGISPEMANNYHLPSWLVFEKWHLWEIFLMDGVTYIISSILIWQIKYTPANPEKIDRSPFFRRLKNGVAFLKENKPILYFGAFSYAVFVLLIVHGYLLLQIYISDYLKEDGMVLGMAEVFQTIGALSAGIWVRRIFRKVSIPAGVIILMLITFIILIIAAISHNTYLYLMVCLFFGIANSGTRVLRVTYLFTHVPNHTIGRVSSVFQTMNVSMRIVLIGLFGLPFFLNNITYAYWVSAITVGIFLIPLLIHYQSIKNPDCKEV